MPSRHDERPAPFTTPEIDVRDLDGFMLNAERLMASELFALSSGDEFKAAVALWCRAWKQIPAASLPNDERVLAAFSGARENWPEVREMALRGFVLCSDGRLHHKTLSGDARRAFGKKMDRRTRTQAATEARKKSTISAENQRDVERNDERHVDHKPNVTTSQRQDRDRDRDKEEDRVSIDRPVGVRSRPARAETPQPGAAHHPPKGTRWPAEQTVPEDWHQAAGMKRAELGLPTVDLAIAAEKFANYWSAKSGQAATKVDWRKTWINWVLTTENPRNASKPTAHDNFLAGGALALAELSARRRNGGGGS